MTEINKENVENLSEIEMQNLIKENSKINGKELPPGIWKMDKTQLIIELKNILPMDSDIIIENKSESNSDDQENKKLNIDDDVKELVKDLVEEIVEEKLEEKLDEIADKRPKQNRRGKLVYLTLPTGEEIEINGIGRYHQYFKDNYPELRSWSILGPAIRGEKNEKSKIFEDAGFKVRMGEGYQYGHKNQYTKD